MIPLPFDYFRPHALDEATALLELHGSDAKVLAGGHSLVPAMKLRLAQPKTIVDISRIADLNYIRERDGQIAIGAMTTHFEIESSALLAAQCPLLPELARQIGDVQVRNRGTLAGSLAHADPAADWPAAVLALEAELEIAGSSSRRVVKVQDFFVELMQTALQPNEILCEIRVPKTNKSVAYVKFAQKASGFAIAGVAVVLNAADHTVSIAVTGIAPRPYRAAAVESELRCNTITAALIRAGSAIVID